MHGFHANYLTERGAMPAIAVNLASNRGHTRFLRGIHLEVGLTCINCHVAMADHALSLLAAENQAGKKKAKRLKHVISSRKAKPK